MAEEQNWMKSINPRKVIFALVFIVTIIPIVFPLNLPLVISTTTVQYYETVQKLQSGDTVIFVWNQGTAQWGEMGPPGIAQLQQLMDIPGVKIIVISTGAESPGLFESNLLPSIDQQGKQYGTDWVNLGYIPGGETAIAALATDTWSLVKVDWKGTPIDQLPVMDSFHSGADIALVVGNQPSSGEEWQRQFQNKFGTKIVWACVSASYTSALMFVSSGQLSGILNSLRGGAELELLINKPGRGVSAMDAMSNLHLLVLAIIVASNVVYFTRKGGKKV